MTEKNNKIFGLHAVEALLKTHPERVTRLFILQKRDDQKIQAIVELAEVHNIKIELTPRLELDRLVNAENHQGVVALSQLAKNYSEQDLGVILETHAKPLLLILDGVQDPHNLGACLRSADAAGVHAVIAPRDKAVGLTPTVSKVASGAAETVPFIQVTNLARTMKYLQDNGVWLYGAAAEAETTLYQADLKGSVAIVLGGEGAGLRRLTRDSCDVLVKIPMQGTVSSLNVSVATGIFLFEALRQRS